MALRLRRRAFSSGHRRGGCCLLREIGYGEADVPELVAGAVKQQRLLVCAPCPVTDADLEAILRASL